MEDEEWGPWIEHDGKGCPVRGMYAQWVWDNGRLREGVAGVSLVSRRDGRVIGSARGYGPNTWIWSSRPVNRTIRYRIRKPRGMLILERLVASLDAPEGPIRAPVNPPEKVTQ